MKFDLQSLGVERSKEFIDYFLAVLRSEASGLGLGPDGSGQFTERGYEAHLGGQLTVENVGTKNVSWKLVQKRSGELVSVEAIFGSTDLDIRFDAAAHEFVSKILVAALSEKKEIFFKRRQFAAIRGKNLNGEYWLRGYRFAPQYPADDSHLMNAERLLVFDFEVEAVDSHHADQLVDERSDLAAAHMSLIMDVGIYKPHHEVKYALLGEIGDLKHERVSTQPWDTTRTQDMPKKGEVCGPGAFKGSVFDALRYVGDAFTCPKETRRILRGREQTDVAKRYAFDRCAQLYQLAQTVGRHHPTIQISYECAAIEAIITELPQLKSFSDFVRSHYPENVDKLLNYLYGNVRSAHWHAGRFALGETDYRNDFLTDPAGHLRGAIIRDAHKVLRTSIFNWVMSEVAANPQK